MLIIGEEAVGQAIRRGKITHRCGGPPSLRKRVGDIELIVMANDVADNTRKRIESYGEKVQLSELPYSREELGKALGMMHCAAVGVTDEAMAKEIMN